MYAILRVEKVKSLASMKAAAGHMARTRPTPNADPDRQNRVLVGSGDPEADARQRIATSGVRVCNDGQNRSVVALDVFCGVSPEFFAQGRDEKKLQAWCSASVKWLQNHFGPDNVASVILHLDETTPHVTALIVPVDDTPTKAARGPTVRLNAKRWMDGSVKLSKMQDEYAEAVKSCGLERGIRGSKAQHKTVKEFYGELNQALDAVQARKLPDPPGMLASPSERREYHATVQKHLAEAAELTAAAKVRKSQAEQKASAMERTAKSYEAAQFRDIPLAHTMFHLGIEPDRKDPKQYHTPAGRVSISGEKWYNHDAQKGGGGSIDLVMHVRDCDYKSAIGYLAHRAGEAATVGAFVARSQFRAATTVANAKKDIKPYEPPAPVPDYAEAQERLKKYFWRRGLDPKVCAQLMEQNRVYLTRQQGFDNIVFTTSNEPKAAEIRGIDSDYKGLAAGSSRNAGPAFGTLRGKDDYTAVVLVESAIDALSYRQLHPDGDYLVLSTSGVRPDVPWLDKYAQGKRVIVAYDADEAGDRAAAELAKAHKNVVRERPKGGKDWNDLLPKPAYIGQERKEETLAQQVERFKLEAGQQQQQAKAQSQSRSQSSGPRMR